MRHLMTRLFCTTALLLALAPAVPSAAAAVEPEKVSLQPNFTAGYEAKVVMETTRTVALDVAMPDGGKQEKTTSGQQTIEFLFRVAKADASGSSVTLRVDKIELSAKTLRGDFEWKSTDPRTAGDNANRALVTMRPALGATITIDLDAKGNVTRVDNGGVLTSPGELADFVNLLVSGPDVRNRWSPVLSPRKSDFVAGVGETWTGEEKMTKPPFGVFTSKTNYTLKSATDAEAVIGLSGEFTLDAAPDAPQKMFDVETSTVTGTLVWDRTIGLFKTLELEQRVSLRGNGQGFQMGQRTETKVKIRREEKDPAKPQ